MKIWRFTNPFNYQYAQASRIGGIWQDGEYLYRNGVLSFEWEKGSADIGDFTWPGLDTDIVVTDRVAEILLNSQVAGFELKPVIIKKGFSKKTKSEEEKTSEISANLHLSDFWITNWTKAIREKSTITESRRVDGEIRYELIGAEKIVKVWDQQSMKLTSQKMQRIEGQGLLVSKVNGVFRVEEFPSWVFCTDEVRSAIKNAKLTNVDFLEVGDLL